ncbi:hypothetical protein PV733_07300 [Streptomyces europaeiscabiei]|uniref:hypothetical protein n=1 Tax=Streptomyces europaeiscabiei TaxID=146819 RepID=UPI0029AF0042|nr:hypothetical protein [Streptomyces europaeiscabiei]MDX3708780.1 hypothetical protein [Streptomyces europaeiscabiei]
MLTLQTVRERVRSTLADASGPLTTRRIAEVVDTTLPQAARALRRLEDDGDAVRQLAPGGCWAWTTAASAP